jgi:hypothetical protein
LERAAFDGEQSGRHGTECEAESHNNAKNIENSSGQKATDNNIGVRMDITEFNSGRHSRLVQSVSGCHRRPAA